MSALAIEAWLADAWRVVAAILAGGGAVAASTGSLLLALALATLISEDLACIAAGLLAAEGRIGFAAATAACLAGIYAGDLLLFAAGRLLGRRALSRWPIDRLVAGAAVERASGWLARNGAAAIALSRVVPGMRLPTYLASGLLDTSAARFSLYFLAAASLWTPAIVGAAMAAGRGAAGLAPSDAVHRAGVWAALAIALASGLRLGVPLLTWRGRRLALGRVRRWLRWEYWPIPILYAPIALWIARLAAAHRSLTLPTAANPGIPGGGFAGESKHDILRGLCGTPEHALRIALVPAALPPAERARRAIAFVESERLAFPVVVKPDVGERGKGVVFARSADELRGAVAAARSDVLVQEHAPGRELGIFYVRFPDEPRGRVFSVTEKMLPSVIGDGRRTIEELVLGDERAVCQARTLLARLADRLHEVPPAGVAVLLVEVGTHSRGALFLDGRRFLTPALEAAIDRVSRSFPGFCFGRYDVRFTDEAELRAGRGFKILELNGLTAEATHVYDPRNRLRDAYRVLFEQWRMAFEIGRQNRARGARPASLRELARLVRRARA